MCVLSVHLSPLLVAHFFFRFPFTPWLRRPAGKRDFLSALFNSRRPTHTEAGERSLFPGASNIYANRNGRPPARLLPFSPSPSRAPT